MEYQESMPLLKSFSVRCEESSISYSHKHCVSQSLNVDTHLISSGAFETQPFIGELFCNTLTYASASPLFPGHT